MIGLTDQHYALLSGGGTLVVPSQQRAAAVRLAYHRMRLEAGERVWASPRVLPWSAWLDDSLEEARSAGRLVPRRLSRVETWWLWRTAVRTACTQELAVLWPDGLIDAVRRAVLLLEDHGIDLQDELTAEVTVLLRARAAFELGCQRLGALWSASWRACAPYVSRAGSTWIAGFEELGPARAAWLRELGVEGLDGPLAAGRAADAPSHADGPPIPGSATVLTLQDPDEEARAVADWCAGQLQGEGTRRLLVVAPRLHEHRARWVRAFSQRFGSGGPEIVAGPADAPFAIEGGEPLSSYSLVELALQLLALAAGEWDFPTLSAVLRSPYLAQSDRPERLRIDAWLRQQNVDIEQAPLQPVCHAMGRALGEPCAELLRRLLRPLQSAPGEAAGVQGLPATWARRFAFRLEEAGWPGGPLDSDELQQRVRLEELLGEMASLQEPVSLNASLACALLRQLAQRTDFEPATDDPPITLTSDLNDPIALYDGIWVAGLTAEAWPEPARADPMIPHAVQCASRLPGADPHSGLRRAMTSLQGWRRSSRTLTLSYPAAEGDAVNDPSPLLRELLGQEGTQERRADDGPAPFNLGAWLARQAPGTDTFMDEKGSPWPQGRPLHGGARLLELQSLCPFRAFADVRLEADALPAPLPGIPAVVRGQILHRALERFWNRLETSSNLHRRRGELLQLAREDTEQALQEVQVRLPGGLDGRLIRHEVERNLRLFERLIEWELSRGDFEIAALERKVFYSSGGAELELRLDRIDRLPGGELVVFDYKTSKAETFRAHEERPRRPQLPAYALTAGGPVVAVAALHLTRQGIKPRGIADQDRRVPDIKPPGPGQPDWPRLLERWGVALAALLAEILAGEARVAPQPGACDYCHLSVACRVQDGAGSGDEDELPEEFV